jgi:methylation protein EvaC
MTFGKMPIANGFLSKEEFAGEYFFELAPALCAKCKMVQIIEQPAPDRMFHDHYPFFTSSSHFMSLHFKKFAEQILQDNLSQSSDPFVVELGCNDGVLLQNFSNRNIRHLGVEPSANVAAEANKKGVKIVTDFFNETLAKQIVSDHGQADAIMAANVMCHIPDLASVAQGVGGLLKSNGVFVFEDPYLGDIVEKTSYDQIYDEHVFLFCGLSVSNAFSPYGLRLIDVIPQSTHGGSMRYVLAPANSRPVKPSVEILLERERQLGLDRPETFETFRENCEKSRRDLLAVLNDLHQKGRRVVGYGATSKSTTVINYCGITPEHIEFISDTTPDKQGKFTPGGHIPVKPYADFKNNYPEYALLFAWNHKVEIMEKEGEFSASGGKWINFVPKVEVSK